MFPEEELQVQIRLAQKYFHILKWTNLYFAGPLKTRTSNRYIPIDLQSLNLGNLHIRGSEG